MTQESLDREVPTSWKYVKLSHNRRYVHFATFKEKMDTSPGLERLEEKGLCYFLSSLSWYHGEAAEGREHDILYLFIPERRDVHDR